MQTARGKAAGAKRPEALRALGETVFALASPVLGRHGFADSRVVSEWSSIVGESLASRTLPERLVRGPVSRGGGTLYVRVASGTFALELQHLEPLLLERINTYFGYQAVTRLRMKHGPMPEPEPRCPERALTTEDAIAVDGMVSEIDDPAVRQALRALGRSLRTRPTRTDPAGS